MVIIGRVRRIRPVTVNGGCQSQSCAGSGAWKRIGDPFHVPEQVIEERETAQFPVVDDVEPAAFLHRDRLVDRAVLDPLEFLHVHPPGIQRGTRLREVMRT
jgi:hypothetical protein